MIIDRLILADKAVVRVEDYEVFYTLVDKMLTERKGRFRQYESYRERLDMSYFRDVAKDNIARGSEFAIECEGMSLDRMARRIKSSMEYGFVSNRNDKRKNPNGRDVNRASKLLVREIYILEYLQGLTVGCMDPYLGERERPSKAEIIGIFEREFDVPYWEGFKEPDVKERSKQIKVVLDFLNDVFEDVGIEGFPEILGDTDLFWPESLSDDDISSHWSDARITRRVGNMDIFCYRK